MIKRNEYCVQTYHPLFEGLDEYLNYGPTFADGTVEAALEAAEEFQAHTLTTKGFAVSVMDLGTGETTIHRISVTMEPHIQVVS